MLALTDGIFPFLGQLCRPSRLVEVLDMLYELILTEKDPAWQRLRDTLPKSMSCSMLIPPDHLVAEHAESAIDRTMRHGFTAKPGRVWLVCRGFMSFPSELAAKFAWAEGAVETRLLDNQFKCPKVAAIKCIADGTLSERCVFNHLF